MPTRPTAATANSGDTLGRGMDFALVVLVFLGIGALVDRWLGTWPAFAIALVIFAMVGQFVKMYFDYKAAMEAHEAARAQARQSRRAA
jgi:F0F1-type ATP synthase assembly protein I